jgi:plasmid maintenance system antidote protein VapI
MREVIIQAIEESGKSVRSIALNAGITQPQLSRFVKGERDLLLDAVDKLAKSLGLQLRKIDDYESS